MELTNLTFIMTDDCNFQCSYCPQVKRKNKIQKDSIKSAVDFFYPFLKKNQQIYICYYGGEPLLAFEEIKLATSLIIKKNKIDNKKIKFSITTNGSLITQEVLDFFDTHAFSVTLSFDGLAQDKGRKINTMEQMITLVNQLNARPGIDTEINSVFAPLTISTFSDSIRFLIQQNSPDITFNFSTLENWNRKDRQRLKKEIKLLTDYLIDYYDKTGRIPVKNFCSSAKNKRVETSVYKCSAGQEQVAITPDGDVWGCYLFHDYFKNRPNHSQFNDYSFGTLTQFIADNEDYYHKIKANYSQLRQDFFKVEGSHCFLCAELSQCLVCPLNAAYNTGQLGEISCLQCSLSKIERNAIKQFQHYVDATYN